MVSLPPLGKQKHSHQSLSSNISESDSKSLALLIKHKSSIQSLKQALGFTNDATVIAWLLDQIERSSDIRAMTKMLLESRALIRRINVFAKSTWFLLPNLLLLAGVKMLKDENDRHS